MPAFNPGLQAFPPKAFAMLRATGIVSVAAYVLSDDIVGWILSGINAVACPTLPAIARCRLLRYPRAVHADVVDHGREPGFLPLVAATTLPGGQLSTYHVLSQALPWLLGLAAGL
ncbi:SLAC1 family transporter [Paraburkholderia nemoris]|jgi:hypothetical protein|uniref:SLAC1 family transporter n=1 Tax=Paraburkholderia nemoris TaxID=2793076 RepID=UPI0038BAF913